MIVALASVADRAYLRLPLVGTRRLQRVGLRGKPSGKGKSKPLALEGAAASRWSASEINLKRRPWGRFAPASPGSSFNEKMLSLLRVFLPIQLQT